MPVDQQRATITTAQGIQLNQIQAPIQQQQTEIKQEIVLQTQQKPSMQVLQRSQHIAANQPFITQSLPSNNINIEQQTTDTTKISTTTIPNQGIRPNFPPSQSPIDDTPNAGPNASSNASYNQKSSERMRQDEGKLFSKQNSIDEIK